MKRMARLWILRAMVIMRWTLALCFIVALAYLFNHHLSHILHWIESLGIFAPLLFLLLYCLTSVLCLPNVLLAVSAGALFGVSFGLLLNLLGATLGAICGFRLSRFYLPRFASLASYPRIQRMVRQVDRQGWKAVALLRLTPGVPYNLVNYGLGATQIPLSHFVLATFIFLIPNKAILTYCGYAGVSLMG